MAGGVLALAGVAVLVCVALISSADLQRPSVLAQAAAGKAHTASSRVRDMKHAGATSNSALRYLQEGQDVAKPRMQRLHMLSLNQQMGQSDNVDDLGMDGTSSRFVRGPDGLRDDGDLADVSLLNSLTHSFKLNSDRADAIQARYEVPTNKLYQVRGKRDMATEAQHIDSRGEMAMGQRHSARSPFHVLSSGSKSMSDVDTLSPVFHIKADNTAGGLEGVGVDLGEESEAEAMANPNPAPAPSASKGIWVEPGSNKGFDSFALDSLQVSACLPTLCCPPLPHRDP